MKKFLLSPAVFKILKFVVSIGLLAGLLWYIDFSLVWNSVIHADLFYIVLGIVLLIGNVGMQFIRWRYLLKLISPSISNNDILMSLLIGFSAGFFTPAQIGEVGGRIASMRSVRASHIVGMSMIDRLYILALTMIVGGIALCTFFILYMPSLWSPAYTSVAIVAALLILGIFLFPSFAKKVLMILPEKIRRHRLYAVFEIIETNLHTREARILFLMTSVFIAVIVVQYHLFINAFDPTPFSTTVLCAPSVLFVKSVILPISIGDLGIRESAAIFFYTKAGTSAAAAFNASLCMFFVNIFLPSLAGAFFILRLKSKSAAPTPST